MEEALWHNVTHASQFGSTTQSGMQSYGDAQRQSRGGISCERLHRLHNDKFRESNREETNDRQDDSAPQQMSPQDSDFRNSAFTNAGLWPHSDSTTVKAA